MSQTVAVVIREDPLTSARAVEALRIALGLGAGEDRVSIYLLDNATLLLAAERDEIIDVDILEKYLPSLKQLETEFVVVEGTKNRVAYDEGFCIHEVPLHELQRRFIASDRALVF